MARRAESETLPRPVVQPLNRVPEFLVLLTGASSVREFFVSLVGASSVKEFFTSLIGVRY